MILPSLRRKVGERSIPILRARKISTWLLSSRELDILSDMMKHVVEKDIQPDEKLMEMIYTHLDAVKEVVFQWYSSCQFLSGYLESGESAQTFRCYRDPAFQGGSA